MSNYIKVDEAKQLIHAIEYATPPQVDAVNGLLEHGSMQAAADALGVSRSALADRLASLARRAARAGWSPAHDMQHTVPKGYHVKGVSTYYGKDGGLKGQWVKSGKDADSKVAELLELVGGMADRLDGRSAFVSPPPEENQKDKLLCVYPMGDPHIGMFAWAQETGMDFDLKIAERELYGAVDKLVELAPAAKHALLINLGDFFHGDSPENRTARAGHALDIDTRWAKVLQLGLDLFVRMIERALEKHEIVTVICEIGNHDDNSSVFLAIALASYFRNNPRVKIDTSPAPFHWYRFGKCLIGTTHGHGPKLGQLPGIMATDRPEDWGQTEFREWYVGHFHHDRRLEHAGASVEVYRTLAPKDAWTNWRGYRSQRDMKLDVWHEDRGKVTRHIIGAGSIFLDETTT